MWWNNFTVLWKRFVDLVVRQRHMMWGWNCFPFLVYISVPTCAIIRVSVVIRMPKRLKKKIIFIENLNQELYTITIRLITYGKFCGISNIPASSPTVSLIATFAWYLPPVVTLSFFATIDLQITNLI